MTIIYAPDLPLVYVCAKYSDPSQSIVWSNVLRAIEVGASINRTNLGWAVVPHQLGRNMEGTLTPEAWYGLTRAVMRRCDAVWVVDDHTLGCAGEISDALDRGMPVGMPGALGMHGFLAGLRVSR